MFNIVLINPEISQNIGNVAESAITQKRESRLARLPQFSLDEKRPKRARFDCLKFAEIKAWKSRGRFLAGSDFEERRYFSEKSAVGYGKAACEEGDLPLFDKESSALDETILKRRSDKTGYLPILNLRVKTLGSASAATAAAYEAMK